MSTAGRTARDDTRLDHCILLPFTAMQLVIMFERAVAECHWSGIAPGPQAEVDPIDETFRGSVTENLAKQSYQPGKVFLIT